MRPGFEYVAALAGVHAIGAAVLLVVPRSCRDLLPRFALTGLLGTLTLTAEMFVLAIAGVPWSIPRLSAVPAALALAAALRRPTARPPRRGIRPSPIVLASLFVVLLAAYAAITGRATSMDLVLFWGAKSERFALARTIDVEFLRQPDHYLMHPDYPPLLPFLNAFGTMAAGRFPWGASLLVMPWFLAIAAAAYHARTPDGADPTSAGWLTAVFTGAVGLAAVAALTAGNADLILIAYETAAIALLIRTPGTSARWAAGLALAGACLVKFEGAFFAAVTVAAFAATTPRGERARGVVALAIPPTAALGAWLLFCRVHGLLDFYAGGRIGPFTLRNLARIPPAMLKAASYDALFIPWVALALAALCMRRKGFVPLPAAVAGGLLAFNVFVYLHGTRDPTEWIGWSAGRTLITVLACGFLSIGADQRAGAPCRIREPETIRIAATAAEASASPTVNDLGR